MNKFRYAILNGHSVLAMVYEDEKYGRTMVILKQIDSNLGLQVYDSEHNKYSEDRDLI